MKIYEIISETASGGSTSAGGIASIATPLGGSIVKRPSIFGYVAAKEKPKKKKKKKVKENLSSVKTLSIKELAVKHKVSTKQIMNELRKGVKAEQEHTTDVKMAKEIALDHLAERPDYYSMLNKAEKSPINESMDFNAGKLDVTDDYPNGIFSSVLNSESYYDFSQPPWNDPGYGGGPNQDEPPINPNYNTDEAMNVSNHNAKLIIEAMGLPFEDDHFNMEINEFLGYATQYLKRTIGKQSPEVPVSIEKNPGKATMVGGGKPEGYYNKAIMRMTKIARIGRDRGASHVWLV